MRRRVLDVVREECVDAFAVARLKGGVQRSIETAGDSTSSVLTGRDGNPTDAMAQELALTPARLPTRSIEGLR